MRSRLVILLVAVGLAACGGGKNNNVDAASGSDAPIGGDGSPNDGTPNDGTPPNDGAPPNDGTPPSDAPLGTTCGTATCDTTQECCVGAGGSTCVATGTCQTTAFQCDGPEDCASNEVCCFGAGGMGSGGTECKAATMCQNNACHVDTDCAGNTSKCCALQNVQYSICLGQCPP